jgi:large subunit ribosomal protein L15
MELNDLKIAKGSRHLPKRVGLGLGSGMGKTSTRGQKGQGARQGQKVPLGFEGGNLPLFRRVPKHGFVSPNRLSNVTVSLDRLADVFEDGTEITMTSLVVSELIPNLNHPVKILAGTKELTKKFAISAQGFSKAAKAAIEKAGGKATVVTLKESREDFHKAIAAVQSADKEDK